MAMISYSRNLSALLLIVVMASGCASVQERFSQKRDQKKEIGVTTKPVGSAAVIAAAEDAFATAYASLSGTDTGYYSQTFQEALEKNKTNVASTWSSPETGNSGTITPTKTFQTPEGTYCREYTQTIAITGKSAEGSGVACRQPDNTWKTK